MTAVNLRLAVALKAEALEYAQSLGISLNALVAVAVREYLDVRKRPRTEVAAGTRVAAPAPTRARRAPTPAAPASPEAAEGAPSKARGDVPKVGRNDPCPCGSGLKYKRCHGA